MPCSGRSALHGVNLDLKRCLLSLISASMQSFEMKLPHCAQVRGNKVDIIGVTNHETIFAIVKRA